VNIRIIFSLTIAALMAVSSPAARGQDTREMPSVEIDLPAFSMDIVSVLSTDMRQSRVDLYIHLLNERVSFIRDQELFRAETEFTVTITDSSGRNVEEKMWTESLETRNYDETVAPGAGRTLQRSFVLLPGKYLFDVQNRDVDTRKNTRISRPVTVRDFRSGSLSLSDILLIQSMSMTEAKAVISPNISANVVESESGFNIFFEAYCDSAMDSVVLVALVRSIDGTVMRADTLVKHLPKMRNACFMNVATRNLPPGPYSLVVEAWSKRLPGSEKTGVEVAGANRTFFIKLRGLPLSILDIDRAIDQLLYIADRDLIEEMKKVPPEAKKEKFLAYWKKKDPFPSTGQNELMEEYYSRVEYANKNFGHYQEGWRTDRGMVYIVFGPPSNIERHPFDIDSKPYEIWTYYNLNRNFIFVDYNGFGDYRLQNPIWDTWMPRNR
jgi:GWxTD domain-containing protein